MARHDPGLMGWIHGNLEAAAKIGRQGFLDFGRGMVVACLGSYQPYVPGRLKMVFVTGPLGDDIDEHIESYDPTRQVVLSCIRAADVPQSTVMAGELVSFTVLDIPLGASREPHLWFKAHLPSATSTARNDCYPPYSTRLPLRLDEDDVDERVNEDVLASLFAGHTWPPDFSQRPI